MSLLMILSDTSISKITTKMLLIFQVLCKETCDFVYRMQKNSNKSYVFKTLSKCQVLPNYFRTFPKRYINVMC